MVLYYPISLVLHQPGPDKMFRQIEKDGLYLSPHGLLAGFNKMACLDSRELAEKFLEAYMPRLQERYGADLEAKIEEWSGRGPVSNRDAVRIKRDSDMARKRLETGILAANRRPEQDK